MISLVLKMFMIFGVLLNSEVLGVFKNDKYYQHEVQEIMDFKRSLSRATRSLMNFFQNINRLLSVSYNNKY